MKENGRMLKEIHTITPICIDNRGELGCAREITNRLFKYLVQSACNGEGHKNFRITFETLENKEK